MPFSLVKNKMMVKKDDGQYMSMNAIADATTSEKVAELEAATAAGVATIGVKTNSGIAALHDADEVIDMFADAFDGTKDYKIGDYVIYPDSNNNNYLYRFISAHAAGEWSSSEVTKVILTDEIEFLNSTLYSSFMGTILTSKLVDKDDNPVEALVSGTVNPTTGAAQGTVQTAGARTPYIKIQYPMLFTFENENFDYDAWLYSEPSTTAALKSLTNNSWTQNPVFIPYGTEAQYFRIGFKKAGVDEYAISETTRNTVVYPAMSFKVFTDDSLSKNGVAAEGKAVGEAIDVVKTAVENALERVSENTRNLYLDANPVETSSSGYKHIYLTKPLAPGTYTFSARPVSTASTNCYYGFSTSTGGGINADSIVASGTFANGSRSSATITFTEAIGAIRLCAANNVSNSDGYSAVWNDIQIEASEAATPFIPAYSATDHVVRDRLDAYILESTNDNTDRTEEITRILEQSGHVILGNGKFYTTGIDMPESSTMEGLGDKSQLYLTAGVNNAAIAMSKGTTVKDLTILGAEAPITLDGNVAGTSDFVGTNLYTLGDQSFTSYTQPTLETPLPPGDYIVSLTATSTDTDDTYCYFGFADTAGSIGSTNIFAYKNVARGSKVTFSITLDKTAYRLRFCASSNVSKSTDDTATFSNIVIYSANVRAGISWAKADNQYGVIENCRIGHFSGAGILLENTKTPTDHNVLINNCHIYNNNIGIYIRRDSEFNRISNCSLTWNYWGILNRGGNNNFDTCGIDRNIIGIQWDADEGSNGGHGTICNCSINHTDSNTGYGIIIRDTGRAIISNCNLYYSKTLLENTNGNVINGCGFGSSAGIEIVGGQNSMICNCMMASAAQVPITLTNNTAAKVLNCYTRAGAEIII